MDIASIILIVFGLILFETISSIDNAIINAQVLSTMGAKARRWFLLWGIITSVFLIRGLLPWLIVYITNPSLGLLGSLTAALSSDPHVIEAIESSAPVLLMGAGIFLVFLFSIEFIMKSSTGFHLSIGLFLSNDRVISCPFGVIIKCCN